jgi:pyruvate dehydrogenase E2 component (dihydrolipoamide acetyltransferase)
MADVVRMPSILAGASEASISKWLVEIGSAVVIGEPLAELETEKAIVEYSAEITGTLGRIIVIEGDAGEIGAPIAIVIADGEGEAEMDAALGDEGVAAVATPDAAPAAPVVAAPAAPVVAAPAAPVVAAPAVPVVAVAVAAPTPAPVAVPIVVPVAAVTTIEPVLAVSHGARIFATPLARKMAKDKSLDLSSVRGTGPGGRIVRRDLEGLSAAPIAGPAAVKVAGESPASVVRQPAQALQDAPTLIPHTGMRKAIARRLTESKSTVPHFYLTADCKVDALLALRAQINAASPVRVSVNDLVVKAISCAFVEVPEANVTWTDGGMLQHSSIDISVAVSTDGGLLTPVLRDVASLSITQVTTQVKELVAKARDKRLRQDELEGGSFAVSNLGMFGTQEFSAILNPPQSGILAVGAASPQPVVIDGALAIAQVMKVTLSADHRAVDGALAATWLAAFVRHIESPIGLLL